MKKLLIITGIALTGATLIGCGGSKGNNPGETFMPDMAYSRAYETFNYNSLPEDHDLKSRGAYYSAAPVAGTVARGDAYTFPIASGDSGYAQAASYQSPMQNLVLTPEQKTEAERLYLINCGICHGAALDGNGPLWKNGDGPYPAKPQVLNGEYAQKLSDAQIYHVITYGKGQMGSYASQLKPEQRWWIINYMRSKGAGAKATTDSTSKTAAATTANDSTAKK